MLEDYHVCIMNMWKHFLCIGGLGGALPAQPSVPPNSFAFAYVSAK